MAASLAGGAGVEAAELAVRAAVMVLGRSVLEGWGAERRKRRDVREIGGGGGKGGTGELWKLPSAGKKDPQSGKLEARNRLGQIRRLR